MSNENQLSRAQSRSAARLAAVQALYQKDMEDIGISRLLIEFHEHRLGAEIEDNQYAKADRHFFDDIVMGTDKRRAEIDALIEDNLGEKWSIKRLDKTMLQILRAGCFELLARADVSTATIINEYVDVAHAFFDEAEAKFTNGLLDAAAKKVRV
ncbi:transcription antitermination factor NusB [Sphingorhabdus lutea]|uniref:Transcription antitermination protein NusB n=1 Tax=Sphingorhabdus lutea TaxID=1913578 RepID=A0A1L3JDH4_9SPHN|nr:transcription antitermination factor NusB [Sphingorhabdus lutea]APG63149.1 transcription antitermination factor NusB [Sphingorhabdus lutea]